MRLGRLAERTMSMADDEQNTSGAFSRLVQDYIGQLRATTENLTQWGGRLPPLPGPLALPGALSSAQITSITDGIAAQRRSIGVLQAQLSAFDEQLAMLENILGPLAEWSRAWADLEQQFLNMGQGPQTGGKAS
jgi:hypothetical protein